MQSQVDKLYDLLKDGQPHRTDQIQIQVYGGNHLGVARIGARIFDIKKKYGVEIIGWKDPIKPSLWWYKIQSATPAPKIVPSVSQFLPALSMEDLENGQPRLFNLEPVKREIRMPV